MWSHCLILIIFAVLKSCLGETCLTTNDSTDKNAECKFPWKFNGKTLNECTDDTDPDGKFWCSTKVDDDLEHIAGQGNWGFCRQSCPPITPTTTPTTTTTTTREPSPTPNQNTIKPNGVTDRESGIYHPNENDETCGVYLGAGFILGGNVTKRGELPYQAALGYRGKKGKGNSYNCGGTLINRRYVITASHCHDKKLRRFQIKEVVLGEWDLEKDPDCEGTCKKVQRFNIRPSDVTMHEDWDINKVTTDGNDIALIRLPRLALTIEEDFDQLVSPVCLGWDQTIQVPDHTFVVSGWGRTNNDGSDLGDFKTAGAHSSKLLKLIVPRIPLDKCKADFPIFEDLPEKVFCAGGEEGKDSCSGDSGGPLVAQVEGDFKKPKYLVGIVSFGTSKCAQGIPGVYTSIDYYLPWILENMKP